MAQKLTRREFLATTAAGALCLGASRALAEGAYSKAPILVSPGCRKSKVRVAKIYMGVPGAHWPTPKLDLNAEVQRYEGEFTRLKKELSDVDFIVSQLVSSADQVRQLKEKIKEVDGILAIHLSMGIWGMLPELLSVGKPTVLFAVPYSGHDWTGFGPLRKQKEGALTECMLTDDYDQLAVAIRPFRAIHHLREAKILNVTKSSLPAEYVKAIKDKFGTEIKKIEREEVLKVYEAVPDSEAQEEANRWMAGAEKIVEPSKDEIFRSCKLALALQKILDDEEATVVTVDCYGTMWRQLLAYPCISHSRMNSMGLGGVCESDLQSSMTHIIFQGLAGKPGFVNDPTMDVSTNSIILAHCMGTVKMDGPDKEPSPYKLRCVLERQEGAVPQVRMRRGEKATTAELIGTDLLLYFTGKIIDSPDIDRGCRTKMKVMVDGDAEKLWQNWSHGLHRSTCYGDLSKDLARFCRFKAIQLVNEAA